MYPNLLCNLKFKVCYMPLRSAETLPLLFRYFDILKRSYFATHLW